MSKIQKKLAWLTHKTVTTPPFSKKARLTAGYFLRKLQMGETLGPPEAKKLPDICSKCYELRIRDKDQIYRIVYQVNTDCILIVHWFLKKSGKISKKDLAICKQRIRDFKKDSKTE